MIDEPKIAQASPPASHRLPAGDDLPLEAAATRQARTPAPRFRTLAVALIVAALPAQAHDRYEIWTIALVRPAHLELAITMAYATAMQLVDPEKKARGSMVEIFTHYRPRLEREAAALYVLTAARNPLVAEKIEVELTEENDITFRLAYPRPPAGPLHFHAALLKKLGPGYGGILDASTSSGDHLGWEQLSSENPNFEITIPGRAPAKK